MSKQQTAVDWMIDRLKQRGYLLDQDILQAKAMEKQQIETAYNAGREYGCKHDDPETGEQYYTENFETESE